MMNRKEDRVTRIFLLKVNPVAPLHQTRSSANLIITNVQIGEILISLRMQKRGRKDNISEITGNRRNKLRTKYFMTKIFANINFYAN